MKKIICLLLVLVILFAISGCGNNNNNADDSSSANSEVTSNNNIQSSKIDVDLTALSSTMVYSEVYNMLTTPSNYLGKTVKMSGNFSVYHDEQTGKYYYACLIADATSCCSQGIEFVLDGDYSYPNDYPELNSAITVTGTFDTYKEGDNQYCQLINAKME